MEFSKLSAVELWQISERNNFPIESVYSYFKKGWLDMNLNVKNFKQNNGNIQRGLLWDKKDVLDFEQSVINRAVFNPIVLAHAPTGSNFRYLVIDGKQRINAIVNIIDAKGGEHPEFVRHFIPAAFLQNGSNVLTDKQIAGLYSLLNTPKGKPQDEAHLKAIDEFIKS